MILIFNAGSSSLKAKMFNEKLKEVQSFRIERIGAGGPKSHKEAAGKIVEELKNPDEVKKIGHRVVHGGDKFKDTCEITPEKVEVLEKLSSLAPLHNPPAIEVITSTQEMFSQIPHYAVFDTSFFTDLPKEARIYPLPYEYYNKEKIKRFGFHGISHEYAFKKSKKENLITVHLGQGCSMTAIKDTKPIDTSMGFTPLEGLPMMTRSGSIDPGIIFYLIRKLKMSPNEVEEILEKKSGLLGLSGVSGDMRDILFVAGIPVEDKDYQPPKDIKCDQEYAQRAKLAIDVFIRSVKKQIGAYFTLLDKAEAVVFTGEIGHGSSRLRKMITRDLRIEVLAIKPEEELAIAEKISKL